MNPTKTNNCDDFFECEKREEIIGVLLAISIVSKRLAGRLSSLGEKAESENGGRQGKGAAK